MNTPMEMNPLYFDYWVFIEFNELYHLEKKQHHWNEDKYQLKINQWDE